VPEIEKHPRLAVLRGFVAIDHALDARRRDDHEGAVRLLDQAMRHGDYWAYRSERAKELYRLGRYREALADCEYWIAHGTIRGEALLWKARSLEKLGRSAEAAAATDLARKLDPTRR
jgi:tetratricopeptide (TPR) repeat protein